MILSENRLPFFRLQALVHGAGDGRERCIQVGAQRRNSGDDSHRYSGRDQAVFDRGRTPFIFQETQNNTADIADRQIHDWALSPVGLPCAENHRRARVENARARFYLCP